MRISDWSSDVCSSDLRLGGDGGGFCPLRDAERGCRLVLLDPADPLHLLEAEAVALHETASGATPIMLCSVCHATAVSAISLMSCVRNARIGSASDTARDRKSTRLNSSH